MILPVGFGSSAGGTPANAISRSLRFNSADTAYLNRTFGTPTDNKKWTFSCWIKRSKLSSASTGDGAYQFLCTLGSGAQTFFGYGWTDDNDLVFGYGGLARIRTNAVFRDLSAWYHVMLVFDSANATAANRALIYINGVAASLVTINAVGLNDTTLLNSAVNTGIGEQTGQPWVSMDMYLAETYFIDGQALTPSSFGETDSATGVWKPKSYTGTYGNNGFYVNFSDNSNTTAATLGKDYSGNGNNWTPNNFSVTAGAGNDSLVDSPTAYGTDTGAGGEVRGNYCTFNPIAPSTVVNGTVTRSDGNLVSTDGGTTYGLASIGTIAVSSGKWYWEVTLTTASDIYANIGVVNLNSPLGANLHTGICYRQSNGYKDSGSNVFNGGGAGTAYGATYAAGDVIGVALDLDGGTITFYKNGVSQGTAYSSISGNYTPGVGDGANGSSYTFTLNCGQRAFAYTAPSGFKALCTTNLPTPTIGATSTTQANDYFDVTTYSGQNTSLTVTNSGSMQPDFVWIKSRNSTDYHNLVDAVRGTNKNLFSNTTDAEDTVARLTSFNSNGITLAGSYGYTNISGQNYVAWQWNAGGSNATNTSGTITSTVRANTTAGFSIVTYTGTGANATVGHGLGVAPSMVIVKKRSASENWVVYHTSVGATKYLVLNLTDAETTSATRWNNTAPTSTVFSIGTSGNVNDNTGTYVAYCFAPVAGYSAFGSYTGNGSTDGPFVYTGFRPRYVLVKCSSAIESWEIIDTARNIYNAANSLLEANVSSAEVTTSSTDMDYLSNGFKVRNTRAAYNTSSATYIYMAFAENPFKYSLAR